MPAKLDHLNADERDFAVISQVWRRLGMAELADARRLKGRSHRVYECTDAHGASWIMRLADPGRSRFTVEAEVIARCKASGLPVPAISYAGTEELDRGPVAVMVQAKAPGSTLAQVAVRDGPGAAAIMLQAGEVLARIHDIATSGYGPVNGLLHGPASTLAGWFIDNLAEKLDAARRIAGTARPILDEAAALLEAHRGLLDRCEPTLVHGDFSPDNILADDTGITAVIDWESAKSGPPGLDIGWWDCFFDTVLTPSQLLIDGYEKVRKVDGDQLNALRHLCVLRVMIGHFSWTLSVNDDDGVAVARERLAQEVRSADSWRLTDLRPGF